MVAVTSTIVPDRHDLKRESAHRPLRASAGFGLLQPLVERRLHWSASTDHDHCRFDQSYRSRAQTLGDLLPSRTSAVVSPTEITLYAPSHRPGQRCGRRSEKSVSRVFTCSGESVVLVSNSTRGMAGE